MGKKNGWLRNPEIYGDNTPLDNIQDEMKEMKEKTLTPACDEALNMTSVIYYISMVMIQFKYV